jgi:hypothetical protein
VRAFAPFAPSLAFLDINVYLWAFHPPNSSLPCLGFLMESFLEIDLGFALDAFKSTFIHLAHLLGMVFEHLTRNLLTMKN